MTKVELELIRNFVNEGEFSDRAKAEINELYDNCSGYNHLINCEDISYVDYPQSWEREHVDDCLDTPLTDDEFYDLKHRLGHYDVVDSDVILCTVKDIRNGR